MSDFRTLALEHAAMEHLELTERIADLQHDLVAYRELALASVHALHRLTGERDCLRTRVRVLVGDLQAGRMA